MTTITAADIERVFGLAAGSVTLCETYERQPYTIPTLSPEQQAVLESCWAGGVLRAPSALDMLASSGVEIAPGVVLGASEHDVDQWTRLATFIDVKHERASKQTGLTWEQVRPAFDATPHTVRRKDGTPWVTTIGQLRTAIEAVGDAYAAADASANS